MPGFGKDPVRVADLHNFTFSHDRDSVEQLARHIHLMRDEHNGNMLLTVDPAQDADDFLRILKVQRGGRLVAQQNLRIIRKRPSDRHPLLLTAA
ncbi:hypothetical protein D3C71_1893730 [compost metagenome]